VPTNEELAIARQTLAIVGSGRSEEDLRNENRARLPEAAGLFFYERAGYRL
jgi:hypothetical protein